MSFFCVHAVILQCSLSFQSFSFHTLYLSPLFAIDCDKSKETFNRSIYLFIYLFCFNAHFDKCQQSKFEVVLSVMPASVWLAFHETNTPELTQYRSLCQEHNICQCREHSKYDSLSRTLPR